MPYDINGDGIDYREPRSRSGKARPSRWPYVLIVACGLVVALAIWGMVSEAHDGSDTSARRPTMDGLTYTYVNDPTADPICVYVVTDPDTGRQYLVSDRGGITPRLEADDG